MSERPEFRARIGRVRMKNGGAEVRIFDRKPVNPEGEDWRGKVVENARAVASFATDSEPLVGYLLLGIYADGGYSFGFRYDPDRCPIPRMLLPSWVAEIIRRDMISEVASREVFNEMIEWQNGAPPTG